MIELSIGIIIGAVLSAFVKSSKIAELEMIIENIYTFVADNLELLIIKEKNLKQRYNNADTADDELLLERELKEITFKKNFLQSLLEKTMQFINNHS